MRPCSSQTSLTISCSLSLLLIGLFMYIDRGKVDKEKALVSRFYHESEQMLPDSTCNSTTVWAQGEDVTSEAINSYIARDSTILEPELYEKMDRISACVHDRNFHLFTSRDLITTSKDLNPALELLLHKYFIIQAALDEKNMQPRELELAISLSKENQKP